MPLGKPARPAPAELPQDRKVARVGGCSGAMFGLPFFIPQKANRKAPNLIANLAWELPGIITTFATVLLKNKLQNEILY